MFAPDSATTLVESEPQCHLMVQHPLCELLLQSGSDRRRMKPSSALGFVLTVLTLVAGCCAYISNAVDSDESKAQVTAVSEGRRFGWAIDWLAGSGVVGQVIANMIVAVFILPPLGPYICAFLDNCDNLKLRARALLEPSTPRSIRTDGGMTEELVRVLEQLKSAYDKYT